MRKTIDHFDYFFPGCKISHFCYVKYKKIQKNHKEENKNYSQSQFVDISINVILLYIYIFNFFL